MTSTTSVLRLAGVVATLALIAQLSPAYAAPKQLRRDRPDVAHQVFADAHDVRGHRNAAIGLAKKMAQFHPPSDEVAVQSATVDLPTASSKAKAAPLQAGSLPVRLGAPGSVTATGGTVPASTKPVPAAVRVAVTDQTHGRRAHVDSSIITLTPVSAGDAGASGTPGTPSTPGTENPSEPSQVAVEVDVAELSEGRGADWAQRAQLVALPVCATTTPDLLACQAQTPIVARRNGTTLTAVVDLPAAETKSPARSTTSSTDNPDAKSASRTLTSTAAIAAVARASGTSGSFAAGGSAPATRWTAGGSDGGFSWSYPLRVPQVAGGLQPDLSLDYSSSSVDGRTTSTNNQSSWVGEGWDLNLGSIERQYTACADDTLGNNKSVRQDLCWAGDNATVSFGAHSGQLVQDKANPAVWRLRDDDGTRFEELTGALDGGSYNKQYWKATTNDGTQYFFGLGKATAAATEITNAALQVPVYGNNSGEPCYSATFASASCLQSWRWNLDHVQDPDGNTITAYYTKESNRYGHDNNTGTAAYNRASSLARIDYGQRAGQESTGKAPAQVLFDSAPRCVQSSADCSSLTSTSAKYWYDVPQDQLCTSSTTCPGLMSPTFFSQTRLSKIRTQYYNGSAYVPVEQWSMTQTYPDPGDGTSPALWLQNIQHTSGSVTTPPVTFAGSPMANRIAGVPNTREPYASALNKYRITKIATESGGEVDVNYLAPDCSKTTVPTAETNARRCFPVYWADSTADPSLHWFDKWVVSSVVALDSTGASNTPVKTTYNYLGSPAWAYDDDRYIKPKYRTWGQWRGYGKVQTLLGDPASETAQRSETLYYRGLNGDRLNAAGGTKTVTVTDSEGKQVADDRAFQGDVREEITYDGLHGSEVEGAISDDTIVATTATGSDGIKAMSADVTRTRTRTRLSDGTYRRTEQDTTFDTYGFETQTEDQGDVNDPSDDTCDRTAYSRNLAAWILDPIRSTQSRATTCAAWPSTPTDDQVLDESRYYYDNKTTLGDITVGHVTKVEAAQEVDGAGFDYYTESASAYDSLGRPVTSTDELQQTSTTAYTPAGAGIVQLVRTTTPDPDGSGPVVPHVTTTTVDPRWGLPTSVAGPDGSKTEAAYDDLGRPTAIWKPGRSRSTDTPDIAYSYALSNKTASAVTTKTLLPNGKQASQVSLVDGLLRPRQTQEQALDDASNQGVVTPAFGRLVSDTIYDNQGNVSESQGPTLVTGSPTTSVAAVSSTAVPSKTVMGYDGAGRVVKQTLVAAGVVKWSTTTAYGGDRVMVTPPSGGIPTTTIVDAEGRTTELRQHTDGTTSGPYDAVKYRYTPAGDLASMTDAQGNTWSHKYDLLGQEVETDDPDAGKTVNTYDLGGQLLTTTDARGSTLAYTYDNLGRTTSLRDSDASGPVRATWAYDGLRLGYQDSSTRMLSGQAVTTSVTARDSAGRPTASSTTVPAINGLIGTALAGTYTTMISYNVDGSPKSVTLPKEGNLSVPEELDYSYDALGRPSGLAGMAGYVNGTLYSGYDELLQTAGGRPGKSTYVTRKFDRATGRLSGVAFDRDSVAKSDEDVTYGYDDAGAITKISAAQPQSGAATDTQCFNLDYLERMTRAWTPGNGDCTQAPSATTMGGPAPYWTDWTFDKSSNRTSQVQHTATGDTKTTWAIPAQGGDILRPHGATSSTVTAPDGTATTSNLTYDAAGNVTGRTSTQAAVLTSSATGQALTYDSEGDLATDRTSGPSPSTVTYAYDAGGEQLLRKDASTTTLYLGSTELKLDQAANTVQATRYYGFAGQTIAVRTGTGADDVSTLWTEINDTASWQVDWKTDTVVAKRTTPYGQPRDPLSPPSSSLRGDRGFVGGTEDATLGFVNVGARDYDPASGSFLSVDPLMDLADPQSWNGYLYGGGNPVSHPDPSGLMSVSTGGGCGACIAGFRAALKAAQHYWRHHRRASHLHSHIRFRITHVSWSHSSHGGHSSYKGHHRWSTAHHSHPAKPSKPKPPSYTKKYAKAAKSMAKSAPTAGRSMDGGQPNPLVDSFGVLVPIGIGVIGIDLAPAAPILIGAGVVVVVGIGIVEVVKWLLQNEEDASDRPSWDDGNWIPPEARSKIPAEWGDGEPTSKGIGQKFKDPTDPQSNEVRVDRGNPDNSQASQQEDHVVVRSGGKVIGRDGKPIKGSVKDNWEDSHIPLKEWEGWKTWNHP